jgi:hypothetical protein
MFNVSSDLGGVIKNAFWRAENGFLPNAPVHILWYIQYVFESLVVSKCVFDLKYF